ncbi:MAG: ABC transporter ATP-binding protein [Chloroflexi bacterium]|nr:ABC transporter ATP-binding protein [Chloroflexota bacterium]
MTTAPTPLRIEALSVRYPNGTVAVNRVDLTVVPGEVFALVGPNGAGKTSLLKAASGVMAPTGGTVRCGERVVTGDPRVASRWLCLMPDPLGVYNDLTAAEYLEFFARALALPVAARGAAIAAAVARLGLEPWLEHEVETLSAGWQRRLALARVLLADAPIVLLDEPASGLDVAARVDLLALVRTLATEGRAVVITSHILPELEQLGDRFGIIERGAWVSVGEGRTCFTRAELARGFGRPTWRVTCSDAERARQILGTERAEPLPEPDVLLVHADDAESAAAVLTALVQAGVKIYSFQPQKTTLSELTLRALGRKPAAGVAAQGETQP